MSSVGLVPSIVSKDFVTRLADGQGGPSHDLADGMEVFGTTEAARVLLSWLRFVEDGVRGLEKGLLGRLRQLRGAVVVGETAVRLEGCGYMMEAGLWPREFWDRLGR